MLNLVQNSNLSAENKVQEGDKQGQQDSQQADLYGLPITIAAKLNII